MGDLRNKIAKVMRAEAERRTLLASSRDREPKRLTLRCDGCRMDGKDHWRKDGTFIRLFSFPSEKGWGPGTVYCEFCVEHHTGMNPHALP